MAQKLVGIYRPHRGAEGLDASWNLTDISLIFFPGQYQFTGAPPRRLRFPGEGMGKGLEVGLEIINEPSALACFLRTVPGT